MLKYYRNYSFLMRCLIKSPWLYIVLMTVGIAFSFSGLTISPDRDYHFYQAFVESLASGKLDLSIPGFHGSNVLAVIWYWISGSEVAEIEFQMFYSLLLPLTAYLAGKTLFNSKWHGLMLAAAVTMMPFVSMISGIGYTSAGLFVLMLLTIYGACEKKWWSGITLGLAITTKPFALALLPLLWIKRSSGGSFINRNKIILLGLLIPALYVVIQYLQAGQITVGVHPELNETTVWLGPRKILLNLAYALQVLFSVHNYHYPNPGGTGHENLIHTSPILIFLGFFALFSYKKSFDDKKLPIALLLGVLIGFGLNAIVATMNEYYMQAGVLLLIIASLNALKKHPIWIPIALATLHFQWFYFYLAFNERLMLNNMFFSTVVVIDLLFVALFISSNTIRQSS